VVVAVVVEDQVGPQMQAQAVLVGVVLVAKDLLPQVQWQGQVIPVAVVVADRLMGQIQLVAPAVLV
jgi:hypothetical protein